MTDIVALDAQRSLPEHVPPELVYDYPLTVANKTTENPFDRIIPELAAGPIAFYARGAVPTGGDAWVFRRAADLRAIFKDTEHFTARGWTNLSALIGERWLMTPVEYDPPEHGPFRALLNPLLAPQRMQALDTKVVNMPAVISPSSGIEANANSWANSRSSSRSRFSWNSWACRTRMSISCLSGNMGCSTSLISIRSSKPRDRSTTIW